MVDWAGMLLVSLLTGASLGEPAIAELGGIKVLLAIAERSERGWVAWAGKEAARMWRMRQWQQLKGAIR